MQQAKSETTILGLAQTGARLFALDALRGLIIILMALDHANHFVAQQHSTGEYWGGLFPVYDSALTFLTRAVTHLAAPGFFFLMGVGMVLFAASRARAGWNVWAVRRHFWLRGLTLIALQFLIVNLAWALSPGGWALDFYVGVLFALGGAMIVASFLLELEGRELLLITAVLLLATQLIVPDAAMWDLIPSTAAEKLLLWPGGDTRLWSNYPILPWLPYAVLGLAYGRYLAGSKGRIPRWTLWVGLAFLALFFLLRLTGGPGNIRLPSAPGWIPFFNLVKYPPSLTYFFLTMGANLVLLYVLAQLGERGQRLLHPLVVFGRVPLFFYISHLFLYAAIGYLLTPRGSTIERMLPLWILGLVLLYPLCLWYGRFKSATPPNSIWRFF